MEYMNDERIEFRTAQLAETKGFDWECDIYVTGNKPQNLNFGYTMTSGKNSTLFRNQWASPTQTILKKWFLMEHMMFVNVDISPTSGRYEWFIHKINGIDLKTKEAPLIKESTSCMYKTYESALEIGLVEALELIE